MNYSTLVAISAVALLAACGGGSTSSSPTASFTTLRVFSDGAGVARGTADDGREALFLTPEVTLLVAEANNAAANDATDIQVSDFPIVQSLTTNANLRSGTVTTGGVTANVIAVEDLGGEAGIVLLEVPNEANFVMVTGSAYGAAPEGTFVYNGTMGMGRRIVNASPELGSFSMSANFSANTFAYNGSTASNTVSGSGVLDTANGRFATTSLSINTSGLARTGTLYGQMHGGAAQSVSGVFHTNEISPVYSGAFVGSR